MPNSASGAWARRHGSVTRRALAPEDVGRLLLGGEGAQDVELPPEVEEAAMKGIEVLPRLPDWADGIVKVLLTLFPIIIVGSWVSMTVTYYNDQKQKREEYEKAKRKKALEYREEDGIPIEVTRMKKKNRKKKKSALDEAIELEEGARKPSSRQSIY